jgi:hypothetical protein
VAAECEAKRLTDAASADEAAKLLARRALRGEVKQIEVRAAISAEVREADRLAAGLRIAKERADADPKAERLRELRAAGKTLAEAFEIIESEGSSG